MDHFSKSKFEPQYRTHHQMKIVLPRSRHESNHSPVKNDRRTRMLRIDQFDNVVLRKSHTEYSYDEYVAKLYHKSRKHIEQLPTIFEV